MVVSILADVAEVSVILLVRAVVSIWQGVVLVEAVLQTSSFRIDVRDVSCPMMHDVTACVE